MNWSWGSGRRSRSQVEFRFGVRFGGGFSPADICRFAAAVIAPRAAPAQAFAALSQMLSSGFFFVQGLAMR